MTLLKTMKRHLDKAYLMVTSPYKRANWLRKRAYHVGNNVLLVTTSFGGEPYLLNIGDNVTVALDAKFVTHDASVFHVKRAIGYNRYLDKVGPITLRNNCFVGAYSVLLPNTSVGENSILAAGSVLTKHIPDNEVWGGNPAKYIMTTEEYAAKLVNANEQLKYPWIDENGKIEKDFNVLVKKRQKYYFDKKAEK